MPTLRANLLMKQNVEALLTSRRYQRKDLAQYCRQSPSWLTKILREEKREFPLKYWDRIADFFGVSTYQLLQPGLARASERRRGHDRRSGRDRRLSVVLQMSSAQAGLSPADARFLERFHQLDAHVREHFARAVDDQLRQKVEPPQPQPPPPGPNSADAEPGSGTKRRGPNARSRRARGGTDE